ncbi:MAG: acyltransferase family protein [Lachnospiraceae bacterium]|nr:acyltransferase family protein [Lachnospiraceae bacterium]
MKKERILWLDGLKGLACLLVFTHHFMLAFFKSSYFGEEMPSMTASHIDTLLSYEPYGVLINGNFWVCVFLVISAFLLSSQIFRMTGNSAETGENNFVHHLSAMLLKRYPRLMLPAAFVGIANYFLIILLDMCHGNYLEIKSALGFKDLLLHCFVTMWTTTDSSVLGPFWMLHVLLFGSYLAILLALLAGKDRKHMLPVYLLLLYVLGTINHYYTGVVLGVLFAWFLERDPFHLLQKTFFPHWQTITGVLLLFAGLYLGGYPSYVQPMNFYRHFGFYVHRVVDAYQIIHCFGAVCLLAGLFLWSAPGKVLSTGIFQQLGKISFSIYLLHIMVIQYIGYYLMDTLMEITGNYSLTGIIVYLILLSILVLVSALFHGSIERCCDKICSQIK